MVISLVMLRLCRLLEHAISFARYRYEVAVVTLWALACLGHMTWESVGDMLSTCGPTVSLPSCFLVCTHLWGRDIVWCMPLLEVCTHDLVLALCMHPQHSSALCCTAAAQLKEPHQAKP